MKEACVPWQILGVFQYMLYMYVRDFIISQLWNFWCEGADIDGIATLVLDDVSI